jgi:hypothetical protein
MELDRTAQAMILAAFCMMVGVGAIVSILPGRILALSGEIVTAMIIRVP